MSAETPGPFFSVVVPAWNAQSTIAAALASVQRQTFGDFEAIVVDDGSSDRTAAIVEEIATSDRRFRMISVANGGPSRARNIGANEHARGRYLAFLDADDIWAPQKLEATSLRLSSPDRPDALYARIAFFRGDPASALTRSTVRDRPLTIADLLRENPVCTMSNMVVAADRFRQAGGFDPSIVHGEDVEWMIRLAATGARIESIDEVLVFYRNSDSGLSGDLNAMRRGWVSAVATARGLVPDLAPVELAAAEAVHLRYLARRALRLEAPRGMALRLALRGIASSPLSFFQPPVRGGLTFAAACCEPFMPALVRRRLFQNQ